MFFCDTSFVKAQYELLKLDSASDIIVRNFEERIANTPKGTGNVQFLLHHFENIKANLNMVCC
jgi:hypothetical protein